MTAGLLWFRNDLRLHDHAALTAACAAGPVLPVYVLDDEAAGRWRPGAASRWWLHHSLAALTDALASRGVRLLLARGRAEVVLPSLARAVGAATVFAGHAVEPWARTQEQRVAEALAAEGKSLALRRTVSLFDPATFRSKSGTPYAVYTPFSRACLLAGPPPEQPAPRKIVPVARPPKGEALASWGLLPTKPDWAAGLRATWTPGEAAARQRLRRFSAEALGGYDHGRNQTGEDGTSASSAPLHFGEISASEVWHVAAQAAGQASTGRHAYIREVLWREFSIHLLWHRPEMPDRPLRAEFVDLPWRDDPADLRAWQRGLTGIPMVDAGMRQLWQLGWMHNRVRLITASFLVKHLLIAWQQGAAWFWDTLVDADLANNSQNWQWIAGSGADASPFFRVFNPILQGRKFDRDGAYVRRFVPELAGLPDRFIHAPFEAPQSALRAAGVRLGQDYPHPVVDLAAGRARALETYRALRRPAAA